MSISAAAPPPPASPGGAGTPAASVKSLLPFDILRVISAVVSGWLWILIAALIGGAAAFTFAWKSVRTKYTAQVQMVRRELQNNFQASQMGESFQPRQFNTATISSMMRSASLMDKTGAALTPPVASTEMQGRIVIRPEKNTDLITVAYTTPNSAAEAADALNLYAENVVDLTRQMQAQEARELLTFITSQVDRTSGEYAQVQKELMAFSKESGLYNAEKETESYLKQLGDLELKIETARIERETLDYRLQQIESELAKQDPVMQRLKDAREKLSELLMQFKPPHPSVIEQEARVKALEAKSLEPKGDAAASFQAGGNTVANSLYLDILSLRAQKSALGTQVHQLSDFRDQLKFKLDGIPDKGLAQARIKARAASLDETRTLLTGRQREAQLFTEQALGYYRLFAPATPDSVETSSRTVKLAVFGLAGAILAGGLIAAFRALRAALNDTIISPSDLRRLTKSPIIASLPIESAMDATALERWRFSTWANFVKLVPAPPDGALIAGLLSAENGEGKTTWLRHLGRAALDRGLKVLAITGTPTGPDTSLQLQQALTDPDKILQHLRAVNPPAVELYTDTTKAWTPVQRQQWREALQHWSTEPALVILVELPPASRIDSLLLAETLPAVIWLSESGRLRQEQVSDILRTIRQSGVRLTGALLNRIPPLFQKLPDLAKLGLCLGFFLSISTGSHAQESDRDPTPAPAANIEPAPLPLIPAPLPAENLDDPTLTDSDPLIPDKPTPAAIPIPPPPRPPIPVPNPPLAPWQKHLTLGPGDLINLQVYGRKEYTRTEVPIGPDGTLNYLQVHGYKADGQSIDEIRAGLTKALQAYIANAQVIVTPSAYRSKKYFLLGTIMDRGSYTLERPMSLLEAAARARGLATGLMEQNTVEIADMRRAFIIRDGKKLDVDFTRLFYQGDTTQNIQLQPGDYIYFPSNVVNEVYILGAVGSPGQLGVSENLTTLAAIGVRGGFTPKAWRKKVVVVRGTLTSAKPEVIEVNCADILAGKARDITLQPRDLVYVSEKPWQRATDLLDVSLRAFVQTAAATWTGGNIGPLIKEPLLPTLQTP